MKKNWKEELKNLERLTHRGMWWVRLDRVEEILAEQKKELIEKLDEMAFENDNGYKVELFINWDEAKVSLKHHD